MKALITPTADVAVTSNVFQRALLTVLFASFVVTTAQQSLAIDRLDDLGMMTVSDVDSDQVIVGDESTNADPFENLLAQKAPIPPSPSPRRASAPPSSVAPAPAPAQSARRPASSSEFALEGATRSLGGAGSPTSTSSYMVGDFFVGGGQIFLPQPSPGGTEARRIVGELPSAGGSRRVKISENNSPIPRDRVFYSYNEFVNAIPLYQQGQLTGAMDIDRHTPGFEKTFWGGLGSIELRTPIAYTQNSRVFLNGVGPAKNTEFGNISLALKLLVWQDEHWAVALGTGVNVPTASDTEIFQFGQPSLTVKNQSVHLLPYVGALWRPTDLTYVQSFVQLDIDSNGNTVVANQTGRVGVLNEQTFLYADVAAGYWLFYNPESRFLMGITPTVEFHYSTTLQNADIVQVPTSSGVIGLGNIFNRLDIVNATVGTHIWIGPRSVFTVAGVFPLSDRSDQRQFDSEIVAQFNRLF